MFGTRKIAACVAALAVTTAGLCVPAAAQNRGEMPGVEIDPISFRGPDPAKRFKDIYIEQRLDAQVPLDLTFKDSTGKTVALADYFGEKPVVLGLVYFECPMICTAVLNGLAATIGAAATTQNIGTDYDTIVVSIDPKETPELAARKKENYLAEARRDGAAEGWHFLTGDEASIEALAQSVGFRYYYDAESEQYAHAGGLMFLTPYGRVSSYMLGTEYLPQVFNARLNEAGGGKIGQLVNQIAALCFQYDPTKGAYGLYIMGAVRLGGAVTMLAIGTFWLASFIWNRRKKNREDELSSNRGESVPQH